MTPRPGPVEPAGRVVGAVGVVVAALRAPDLVAHQQHRDAEREQVDDEEVLDLPATDRLDRRVVGRALDAAVPAHVEVVAVAVVLAVRLVVLLLVRDQVVEREAVVAGDEVDAGLRIAVLVAVDVRAAEEPLGEVPDLARLGPHERAHVVAEPPVPLHPAVAHEAADLVEPAGVPRLGDQLGAGQDRVGLDLPEDRRIGQRLAVLAARQDRREVEAEAVDVHLLDPVAEAVEDQPPDDRAVALERVAGPAEVGVGRAVVGVEQVVVVVGEALEAGRRAVGAAFGRVVVDDVEDHLEPGSMHGLDHVAELVERGGRARPAGVGGVRREERDRLVAPVVGAAGRRRQRIELEDREQLDRGHPEIGEVRDLLDEARHTCRAARPRRRTWDRRSSRRDAPRRRWSRATAG